MALKRAKNRTKLAGLKTIKARYDAAYPYGYGREYGRNYNRRLFRNEEPTPESYSIEVMRDRARHLEQNTAIVPAILNHISTGIVGDGVVPDPVLTTASGDVLLEDSDKLKELWYEWQEAGETTGMYTELEAQDLAVRTFYRDGEVFLHHQLGYETANTRIPYSYTLLENDSLLSTMEVHDGIVLDELGRPSMYRFGSMLNGDDVIEIEAEKISHYMNRVRIGQKRGVSAFASIIDDINDIDAIDYAEKVAAKVASTMALVITKGTETEFDEANIEDDDVRDIEFSPGAVIDDLGQGERMEVLESSRPSTEHMEFRKSLQRGIAGTLGVVSYSNMARSYEGTYSSQRQEMVEMRGIQLQHWRRYIQNVEMAKWSRFVKATEMAGLFTIPDSATKRSVYYPNFVPPATPWIDPAKEAKAYQVLIDYQLESREYIAQQRGRDIREIQRQQEAEKEFYGAPMEAEQATAPTSNEDDEVQQGA